MAINKKRSNVERCSGKDRRSGVDTGTEEEKRLVRERRSTSDRRSSRERRLDAKEEIIRRSERAEIAIREHFIATHRNLNIARTCHAPAPGKKHLICVAPSTSMYGHTTVGPYLFGPVTTASRGTLIHSPCRRTR